MFTELESEGLESEGLGSEDLVTNQLQKALGDGDPFEILTLAGLIHRSDPGNSLLEKAKALTQGFLLQPASDLVWEALQDLEDQEDYQSWDVLCQVDELLAGMMFTGEETEARMFAAKVAKSIGQHSNTWVTHAEVAQAILIENGLPTPDPSWLIWSQVANTTSNTSN